MGSPLALVELALVLGLSLGLGFHQLWLLRKSDAAPQEDEAPDREPRSGGDDPR